MSNNAEFRKEYLNSFWDQIMFWVFRKLLAHRKKLALWEANLDKFYMEAKCSDLLNYNETADRNLLNAEHTKAEPDFNKIQELEDRIAAGKSTKLSYRTNEKFRTDMKVYLEMLSLWKKS